MSTMSSQITSLTIDYSTVSSGADQGKHQSSASPAFVRRIHRWPVNSPHKGPVIRKIFPFDDVMFSPNSKSYWRYSVTASTSVSREKLEKLNIFYQWNISFQLDRIYRAYKSQCLSRDCVSRQFPKLNPLVLQYIFSEFYLILSL